MCRSRKSHLLVYGFGFLLCVLYCGSIYSTHFLRPNAQRRASPGLRPALAHHRNTTRRRTTALQHQQNFAPTFRPSCCTSWLALNFNTSRVHRSTAPGAPHIFRHRVQAHAIAAAADARHAGRAKCYRPPACLRLSSVRSSRRTSACDRSATTSTCARVSAHACYRSDLLP